MGFEVRGMKYGKKEKGKRIKMRPENQADVRLTLFTLTNKLINQLT